MAEYSIFCEASDFKSMKSSGRAFHTVEIRDDTPNGKMKILGPAQWRIAQALGTDAKSDRKYILGHIRLSLNCHLREKF